MKKIILVLFLFLVVGGGIVYLNRNSIFGKGEREIVLYGNVDDRQLNLAFQLAERIAEIRVEEGSLVRKGDLLAVLETVRTENSISAAEAACEAAKAQYEKMKNGTRTEDIEIARAAVEGAKAQVSVSESDFRRQKSLKDASAVSVQIAEKAESVYLLSRAGLRAAESNLEKQIAGSRKEDIALAQAQYFQSQAQLAIERQKLKDSKLFAPCDGIVRNRLLHPGEMTSPQSPILTLAVISPKWVRVYLPETLLTKIRNGDKARIYFDSMRGKHLDGWVGFISPNAEFTPKNVETEELRSALVYELRVMVNDPENYLKLGAPATVTFPHVSE